MKLPFATDRKPLEETAEERLYREMYDRSYPILMAPWHGHSIPIQVRELTMAQSLACGDYNLIQLFGEGIADGKMPTTEQMNAYAERHHEICKASMIIPTYDQALKIAGAHVDTQEIDSQLSEIRVAFDKLPKGPEKKMLRDEYNALELISKFLLPADFTAFVVNYALQVDKSDIKSVTEEMLINAAILASRGHDNPSDHLKGAFTDLMKREIDNRAWILFDEEQKAQRGNKKKKVG